MWARFSLGIVVFLLCSLLHTVVVIYVLRIAARLLLRGYAGPRFWHNLVVMQLSTLIVTASHFVQVVIWCAVLLTCGEFETMDLALYASAGNYTTVGTGTVDMSQPWRILAPLEAMNGVLMLGVSTAIAFAVTHRVMESRLKQRAPKEFLDLP
jgi:hypothetical protein